MLSDIRYRSRTVQLRQRTPACLSRTEIIPRNPRKRIEQLEQKLTEIAIRKSGAKCICKGFTLAAKREFFEPEMNQACPVHGFRQLGKILIMKVVIGNGEPVQEFHGLAELVEEYKRRRDRHRQQMIEEDDSEDF